jgi:hypothetical protein
LRRIGTIVAEEQKTDDQKAKVLRWFVRYGWIILPRRIAGDICHGLDIKEG